MKATLRITLCILFGYTSILSQSNNLPPSDYSTAKLLVHFDDTTSLERIKMVQEEFNAQELWISPLSKARYWEIEHFNYSVVIDGMTYQIDNIIDAMDGIERRSNSESEEDEGNGGSGLDYIANLRDTPVPYSTDNFACGSTYSLFNPLSNNPVSVSISDSGYFPESLSGTEFPYDPAIGIAKDYLDPYNYALDLNGHGTHILSIADYTATNSVNSNSEVITYDIRRILNENGNGNLSDIIYSVEHAIIDNAQIINLSLGFVSDNPKNAFLRRMFKEALKHNVLIIMAAGNDGANIEENTAYMPGSYQHPNLITVASVDCRERLSEFSNYGKINVDIAAPGNDIIGINAAGELEFMSGTSQAAGIVCGVAAALATHLEKFDPERIKCALMNSADKKSTLEEYVACGGVVNATEALLILNSVSTECGSVSPPPPPSPTLEASILSHKYKMEAVPNPTTGVFNITNSEPWENVTLFNSSGHVITQQKYRGQIKIEFDLTRQPAGLYFVRYSVQDKLDELVRIMKN